MNRIFLLQENTHVEAANQPPPPRSPKPKPRSLKINLISRRWTPSISTKLAPKVEGLLRGDDAVPTGRSEGRRRERRQEIHRRRAPRTLYRPKPAPQHSSSPSTLRFRAHAEARRAEEVALHLPYLWCETRSSPEPRRPAERLFSASSWSRLGEGERRRRLFSPLLSSFSPAFNSLQPPSPLRCSLLSLSSPLRAECVKQFADIWDPTGNLEEPTRVRKKQKKSPHRRSARLHGW